MIPAASLSRRLRRHWALVAVCAAFLLAGALALGAYDQHTVDGPPLRAIGNAAVDYLAGDGERAFDQLHFWHDRYYGALVEAPLALTKRVLGDRWSQRVKHVPIHLFFLFGGVCCYLLALRMFGSRLLALAAMVLFLLHPRIYEHSFINSKDVPFLVMFMVSLYLTHRAFRRETLGAFLLCGVGVGLLVNLRIMGLALFAAVLVLRGLDLAFAGSAAGRKRALLTGTGFALAAMLTYYASLPVLWTDPVGRFAELLTDLGSHPHRLIELFRGEWRYGPQGPSFDYVPVWIGITTPLATLLLVLIGAVALAGGAWRRPRDLLRDGPLRFGLLLLAIPVVTVVAVVVLENNVYNGWRQLFFLYAPLLLLAVCGLRAITVSVGRWPRAGAYTLAGAAIAVAAVSLVRIHPYGVLHFNSLTDRATPEGLSSTWEIEHWLIRKQTLGATFVGVAADYPAGPLFYASSRWHPDHLLSAEDRKRFVHTSAFRSGGRNFLDVRHDQWCPDLPGARERRLYSVVLSCVVDPVAYLGGYRRAALATEPLARARFAAYRLDGAMVYLRDDCSAEDMDLQFFLRVHPVASGDVPDRLREFPAHHGAYGFEKRDFAFTEYGASIDGNCVAVARLPDYPIAHIETGQYTPAWAEAARRAVAGGELRARGRFDIWLDEDERTLTYIREGCTAQDIGGRFFLHVYPVDAGDIPGWREEHGFENYNFQFDEHGARPGDGSCVAVAPLPAWPIASIQTSQDGGARWSARFAFSRPEVDAAALAGEPLARSVFDVWRDGEALIYVKDGCTEEDAERAFFLHLYPVDEADLPAASREYGFENRDFHLWERGGLADGDRCVAVAPLPDWPIASVRTGQYDKEGALWDVRFPLARGEMDPLALGEPLVRAVFDVWLDGEALVYVKDGCTEDDADAAFALHLYPVDANDLPDAAREHGFENRDFLLWERGGRADGRCVAMVALPHYPIARVETGQYGDTGRRWWVEFAPTE